MAIEILLKIPPFFGSGNFVIDLTLSVSGRTPSDRRSRFRRDVEFHFNPALLTFEDRILKVVGALQIQTALPCIHTVRMV